MRHQKPERIKRFFLALMVVSILGILQTVAVAEEIDEVDQDKISHEVLFNSIAGEWTYDGYIEIYNDTKHINGTRTITLNSPTSAEYSINHTMGDFQENFKGEMFWDEINKQFNILKEDDIFRFNLTSNGYEKQMERINGNEEFFIGETINFKDRFIIINNSTQMREATAFDMDGNNILKMETTYKRVTKDSTTPKNISYDSTQLAVEVIDIVPACSMMVTTSSIDFGKVGSGMISEDQIITVVNTGRHSMIVSAMIFEDKDQFYSESLKLNGNNVHDFSIFIPADTTDLQSEYDIHATLMVPEWAKGKYSAKAIFFMESASSPRGE